MNIVYGSELSKELRTDLKKEIEKILEKEKKSQEAIISIKKKGVTKIMKEILIMFLLRRWISLD